MSEFSAVSLRGSGSRFEHNADLTDKFNYCRHIFVRPDGSLQEVVRLNVWDDRHREDIVAFHFSKQFAKMHYTEGKEQPQFYVVGRDCPWDFEYVMHDGRHFFLEICRIADRALLKAIKAENEASILLSKNVLAGYEVLKIERLFPGTLPEEIVSAVKTKADKKKRFEIGEGGSHPKYFLRPPMEPSVDLVSELKTAISKKVSKKHNNKENTILLLDNLTTQSNPDEFFEAFDEIQDFLDTVPFLSIWLYTGYYSDDRGHDCEFTLVPIKLSEPEMNFLQIDG